MRRSVSASEAHLARGYDDGRARLALLEMRHALRECSGLSGEGAVAREERGLHPLKRAHERADFGLCGGRVRWVRVRGGTLVRAVRERWCVAREDRQRAIYLGWVGGARGLRVDLRARDHRRIAELLDARRRVRAVRTGAGASVVGGGRFHRSAESKRAQREWIQSNQIDTQYESRSKPERHEDRDGGDSCDERDAQRDESDGEGDEKNREHHDRDGNEAEGDETERAREKMADDSKRAGRRRFSRRRFESDWTRHQLLLAYSYSNNRW